MRYDCDSSSARLTQNNLIGCESDSKHSLGFILTPSCIVLSGITYNYFLSEKLSFQTDFFNKSLLTHNWIYLPFVLELSENIVFWQLFSQKNKVAYHVIVGGGINGALIPTPSPIWKVGVNTLVGLGMKFQGRLESIQIDFRPGYGLLFWDKNSDIGFSCLIPHNPHHCFDWSVNISFRFKIKKSNNN